MKFTKSFFGVILTFLIATLASINMAEAYYSPYSYYGYPSGNSYSSFTGYDNFNKNLNSANKDYSDSYQNSFNRFDNYGYNSNNAFGQGYLNNQFGDFSQLGDVNLMDGFSFTKGPCYVKKLKIRGAGADNIFITERVCDNIQGSFYKDNSYSNTVDNNLGFNYGNAGLNANTANSYNNGGFNQQAAQDSARSGSNTYYRLGESTSFGKGTRIIFN